MGWFLELSKNRFQTMRYPATYFCSKDVDRNPSSFPRSNGEMAVIAGIVGSDPSGFVLIFSDHRLLSSSSKRNASCSSASPTKNRVLNIESKSAFRLSEKNVSLLTDLIWQYCPQGELFWILSLGLTSLPWKHSSAGEALLWLKKMKCVFF